MSNFDRVLTLGPGADRFMPQWDEQVLGPQDYNAPPKPDQLLAPSFLYCSTCELTWLAGEAGPDAAISHPSHHTLSHPYAGTRRSLVVHVDGPCPNNGRPGAAPGIGVFFGPESRYNISAPFKPARAPTNQSVELQALVQAMRTVRQQVVPCRSALVRGNPDTKHFRLILVTDSSYAVECLCKHWGNWTVDMNQNVLLNHKGQIIANSDLLLAIRSEVVKLSHVGVQVVYHHVCREYNRDADKLARDGVTMYGGYGEDGAESFYE